MRLQVIDRQLDILQEMSSDCPNPKPVRSPGLPLYRRLTAPWRDLPDHLIIGAQKSGTTQLNLRLASNPGIAHRPHKECHHLNQPGAGKNGYRAFFELRSRRRRLEQELGHPLRTGDATPAYLFHPQVPARAARLLPDCRVIAILRDPALRAWSHYRHERRLGTEPLSFGDAIAAEPDRLAGELERLETDPHASSGVLDHFSYVARGRYAPQLERWFACLPRERFLVLFAEEFFADEDTVLRKIEAFLQLPRTPPPESTTIRNRGEAGEPDPGVIAEIRRQLRNDNDRLTDLLGVQPPWPMD